MAASPPKRKKVYRERVAHVPMLSGMRNRIALQMHSAVLSLQHHPNSDTADEVAKQLAIMTGAIDYQSPKVRISQRDEPHCRAIVAALAAMESIEKRYTEKGVYGVSGDELATLKAASARFDEALKDIPLNVYQASYIFVEQALKPHFKK